MFELTKYKKFHQVLPSVEFSSSTEETAELLPNK